MAFTFEKWFDVIKATTDGLVIKATTDGLVSSDASFFETTCSFLHRIAARPKIIPYTDMVKWIIDQVDV